MARQRKIGRRWGLVGVLLVLLVVDVAAADPARVLPPGQSPHDRRLGPLKDLNGYFPLSPPATKDA